MSCEDIPSLLDIQNTKKHVDDLGRLMGTGTGTSTNGVTGQVRPTYNAVMANLGYTRVGTFASGGTLLNGRQTLLWDVADGGDGQEYGWSGVFPLAGKVVPPGSTPLTTGGIAVGAWMSRFDPSIKSRVDAVEVKNIEQDVVINDVNLLQGKYGQMMSTPSYSTEGCSDLAVIFKDVSKTSGLVDTFRKTPSGWWLQEQFITGRASGGSSINETCEAFRLGPQVRCYNFMSMWQATTTKSPGIAEYQMVPSHFYNGGADRPTVKFLQFTNTNQTAEYSVNLPSSLKDIGILFAGSPGSSNFIVSIHYYGLSVASHTETVSTIVNGGSPLKSFVRNIRNPFFGTDAPVTIKITSSSTDARYGYVGGVCCEPDGVSSVADTYVFTPANLDALEIRPTQSGAMCYVFTQASSNLFGGESHGGETVSSSTFRINGVVTAPEINKIYKANTFDINQTGVITWPNGEHIGFNTIHGIYSKSETVFHGRFYPSDNFTASLVYCPMLTLSSKNWRRLLHPYPVDANTLPDPQTILIDNIFDGATLQSLENRMLAGIRFSSTNERSDTLKLTIKPYAGYDTKLYMGENTTGVNRKLSDFSTVQVRFVV